MAPTPAKLRQVVQSHGWSLDHDSIHGAVDRIWPERLVLDPLTPIRVLSHTSTRYRQRGGLRGVPSRTAVRGPPNWSAAAFPIWVLAVVVSVSACDALFPDDGEVIDRHAFIDAQVELHLATMEAAPEELSEAERDRVLDEVGVTDEQLQAFLTVHGADTPYMLELWEEINRQVLEALMMEPR